MADAFTSSNPDAVALYDESGNRVTLVGGIGANGQIPVKFHSTATTASTVSATTSSGTLLAANTSRKGFSVWNETGQTAYVTLGATATLTNYTIAVAVGGYYEAPYGYTGVAAVITSTGSATLRVTEFT